MQLFTATVIFLLATPAGPRETGTIIEWPCVGAEQAHAKYSAAEAITTAKECGLRRLRS